MSNPESQAGRSDEDAPVNADETCLLTSPAQPMSTTEPFIAGNPDSPELSYQSLSSGLKVSGYVLHEKLGDGGCGVIFRAEDPKQSGPFVALKMIRPDRLIQPKMRERFEREIETLTSMSHPNVVSALHAGRWQGVSYLVMELVDGLQLQEALHRSLSLRIADCAEIARQVALGLQHVHEHRRVHRDIKPANLMINRDGIVKILDLGMAGLRDYDEDVERLTSIRETMGTPDYMAPEQWQSSHTADIRADIYSLGCTLFCLLTGVAPFARQTNPRLADKRQAHEEEPLPDLRLIRPDIPEDLQDIVEQCVAKHPGARFQEPIEIANDLAAFCEGANLAELVTKCTNTSADNGNWGTGPTTIDSTPSATKCDEFPADETDDGAGHDLPSFLSDVAPQPEQSAAENDESAPTFLADLPLDDPSTPTFLSNGPHQYDVRQLEMTQDERPSSKADRHSKPSVSDGPPLSTSGNEGSSASYRSTNRSYVVRTRQVRLQAAEDSEEAEYELEMLLGQGGMGEVYRARQTAVDRQVAFKRLKSKRGTHAEQFLSEAVVTGALEHPNIVPIYDLGADPGGEYFYTMKEVQGVEWSKKIPVLSESQNLDILMRVADAIGFAHEKGVVHRDLKPDNVMIGAFGEVYVMDWGLAMLQSNFQKVGIQHATGTAGTPTYMAPEMAENDLDRIGPRSDIYLLGAILFRVLVGKAPHTGGNLMQVLSAAAKNTIIPHDRHDELMGIALKAMATEPDDRYQTVTEFQAAIQQYREHAESIHLFGLAEAALADARQTCEYRTFERALLELEEAVNLWPGNEPAKAAAVVGKLDYAKAAFQRGDFELAERQLDEQVPEHAELKAQVRVARELREQRMRRLKLLTRVAASLAVVVFVTVTVAAWLISRAQKREELAKEEATRHFQSSRDAIRRVADITEALDQMPRLSAIRQDLLEDVEKYYSELTAGPYASEAIRLEMARSQFDRGRVLSRLARHAEAQSAWEASIKAASELQSADVRPAAQDLIARAKLKLADGAITLGLYPAAAEQVEALINQFKATAAPVLLAEASFVKGTLLRKTGDLRGALAAFEAAADIYQSAPTTGQRVQALRAGRATSLSQSGAVLQMIGQPGAAHQRVRMAIEEWERLVSEFPGDTTFEEGLATSHIDLANALRVDGYEPLMEFALAVEAYERLMKARPEVPHYRFNHATALGSVCWCLNRVGRSEEAETYGVDAIQEMIALSEDYPDDMRFTDGEISARLTLAEVLRDRGKSDLALSMLDGADRLVRERLQTAGLPDLRELFGQILSLRGQVLVVLNRTDEALVVFETAFQQLDALTKEAPEVARFRDGALMTRFHFARAIAAKDAVRATELMEQATALAKRQPEHPIWQDNLAWLLLQHPVPEKRDVTRALKLSQQAVGAVGTSIRFRVTHGLALLRSGKLEACRDLLSRPATPDNQSTNGETPIPESLLLALLAQEAKSPDAASALEQARQRLTSTAPNNPRWSLLTAP